jgi:hypothetical protein
MTLEFAATDALAMTVAKSRQSTCPTSQIAPPDLNSGHFLVDGSHRVAVMT